MGPVGSVAYTLVCTVTVLTLPCLFREAEAGRARVPDEDRDDDVVIPLVGGDDMGSGGGCSGGDGGGGCE